MRTSKTVKKGVRLLNEWNCQWPIYIDLRKLNMRSCTRCILGQLFDDFGRGRDTLGIAVGGSRHYGLDGVSQSTQTWRKVIKACRVKLRVLRRLAKK